MIKIGILGADAGSENLGVQALAFSQVAICEEVLGRIGGAHSYKVISFINQGGYDSRYSIILGLPPETKFETIGIALRNPEKRKALTRALDECDLVIAITGGDSFSDIYGVKRFISNVACLLICGLKETPYIMAPQTFGPFSKTYSRVLAKNVLKRSRAIFARDAQSAKELEQIGVSNIDVVTDVAFVLPYRSVAKTHIGGRRVGVNVSGLLWNGGYTGDNQFGLYDYRAFIRGVISGLLGDSSLTIELIGHVFPNEYSSCENDAAVCDLLAEEFDSPRVVPIGAFDSPIEAKSHICGLDAFMGSRMHATIAAFSAGVPTLPLAYSKKFAGLYGSLGYEWTLDLRQCNTEEAISIALDFVENPGPYVASQGPALEKARALCSAYSAKLFADICSIVGQG